jgi:hypothetical protein
MASAAGQWCWQLLLASAAGLAVLAIITTLLANGTGQYCWRVVLANTVRLQSLRPNLVQIIALFWGRRFLANATKHNHHQRNHHHYHQHCRTR